MKFVSEGGLEAYSASEIILANRARRSLNRRSARPMMKKEVDESGGDVRSGTKHDETVT
jgi:hypothetical protein